MNPPADFCVFILTHGRPDHQHTLRALKREGYTGPVYIVIDNEDKRGDEYRFRYGEKVIEFDKAEVARTFDEGDNFNDRRAIVYARNACFEIARGLGYRYFLELDDDYQDFRYKADGAFEYVDKNIRDLDALFRLCIEYFQAIPATSLAWAQGGDFAGGKNGTNLNVRGGLTLIRKGMNTFFCDTERPFQFMGRINEDVNTYTTAARAGILFFTMIQLAINQKKTQASAGGMTDIYKRSGTYIKSFYSVMFAPSCVTIAEVGNIERRLHHSVSWDHCCPVILREKHRKART